MKKFLFLLFITLFFIGCNETLYYSNYDYFPKNSEKEIKDLPILEDSYCDFNSSKFVFAQKKPISEKPIFNLKRVYNKNNSYIQITFNDNSIEKRNLLKLYEDFYLTKKYNSQEKKFIYSVVQIDNGIITPIHIKNDLIQLSPKHQDYFKFDIYNKSKDSKSYILLKDKQLNNFKKFLIKSLKNYSYRSDEYQYYIDFQSQKNNKNFVKKIIQGHPEALAHINKEIVLEVVKQNGSALQYTDKRFKKDKEVVLAAVKQNGEALEYADDSLKKDKDIILAALKQNIFAIEYIDESYKNMAFKNAPIDKTKLGKLADYLLLFKKDEQENIKRLKDIFSKVNSKVDYDFDMKDIYGNNIKIKLTNTGLKVYGLENKIIIIDIFGSSVPNFMQTRYLYSKLKNKFRDDLEIISFEAQNNTHIKKLKEIALKSKSQGITISLDQGMKFFKFIREHTEWNGYIPFALIINKKHEIAKLLSRKQLVGNNNLEYISKLIKKAK